MKIHKYKYTFTYLEMPYTTYHIYLHIIDFVLRLISRFLGGGVRWYMYYVFVKTCAFGFYPFFVFSVTFDKTYGMPISPSAEISP